LPILSWLLSGCHPAGLLRPQRRPGCERARYGLTPILLGRNT